MLNIRKLILTLGVVAIFSASAFADTINCSVEPGASLCRDMRLLSSYLVTCSGGCDEMFRNQIRNFNDVADVYYGQVTYGSPIDPTLANLAQSTASSICSYSWTNMDTGVLSDIIASANRALTALGDIQKTAGLANPTTCTISQN